MKLFINRGSSFEMKDSDRFYSPDLASDLFARAAEFTLEKDCKKTIDYEMLFVINQALKPFFVAIDTLGVKSLEGKVCLDLGCGCDPANDARGKNSSNYSHKPWLARALHYLGAKVIGVDIGPLDKEEFEHYSLDLMKPGVLDFVKSSSADMVHSNLLDCSPTLHKLYSRLRFDLPEILFPQIIRVMKPESAAITDMDFKALEKKRKLQAIPYSP